MITDAGADPKVSALVYVAALQPDVGEAGGALMSKFAAPNDAMRAAKNRANADKYFFIPAAKFRETYAADVPAADAQFLADSQQQLGEKAMGAPATVAAWHNKPTYAILTTQDHVINPDLQRWMYQRSGAKVTEVAASHAVFFSQLVNASCFMTERIERISAGLRKNRNLLMRPLQAALNARSPTNSYPSN